MSYARMERFEAELAAEIEALLADAEGDDAAEDERLRRRSPRRRAT
jgi:hypothetical protein